MWPWGFGGSFFLLAAPSQGSCELPVRQRTSAVLYLIEMQITLACHWLAGCWEADYCSDLVVFWLFFFFSPSTQTPHPHHLTLHVFVLLVSTRKLQFNHVCLPLVASWSPQICCQQREHKKGTWEVVGGSFKTYLSFPQFSVTVCVTSLCHSNYSSVDATKNVKTKLDLQCLILHRKTIRMAQQSQ